MTKYGVKITSFYLAAMILCGSFSLRSENVFANNQISYSSETNNLNDNSDDSLVYINDNYDEQSVQQYRNAPDDMLVDIPSDFRGTLLNTLHKSGDDSITVGDLRSIKSLTLYSSSSKYIDMSWLNYCSNLEQLNVYGSPTNCLDSLLYLDNLSSLSLGTISSNNQVLDLKNCGFLKHNQHLKLTISACNVNPEQLYLLDNIDILEIDCTYVKNIDFRKLEKCNKIIINGGEYDIAVNLTNEDIDYLEGKGIELEFSSSDTKDKLKIVNDRLDEILKSMNIDATATDDEKIDTIFKYVLENFHYDEEISRKKRSRRLDSTRDYIPFCVDGELYGALQLDSKICKNYAAFIKAMLYRLGIESYNIYSAEHSWNLINVDGEYYYYDATDLDSYYDTLYYDYDAKEEKSYTWEEFIRLYFRDQYFYKLKPEDYIADPSKYDSKEGRHDAINFPISIQIGEKKTGIPNKVATIAGLYDKEENYVGKRH